MPKYRLICTCLFCGFEEVPVQGSWLMGAATEKPHVRVAMCPNCRILTKVENTRRSEVDND